MVLVTTVRNYKRFLMKVYAFIAFLSCAASELEPAVLCYIHIVRTSLPAVKRAIRNGANMYTAVVYGYFFLCTREIKTLFSFHRSSCSNQRRDICSVCPRFSVAHGTKHQRMHVVLIIESTMRSQTRVCQLKRKKASFLAFGSLTNVVITDFVLFLLL